MLGSQPTNQGDDSSDEGENDDAAAPAVIVFLGRSGASWWALIDGGFTVTVFPVAVLAAPRLGLGLGIRPRLQLRLGAKPVALGLLVLGWGFPHGIGFAVAEAKGKRRLITNRWIKA